MTINTEELKALIEAEHLEKFQAYLVMAGTEVMKQRALVKINIWWDECLTKIADLESLVKEMFGDQVMGR